MSNYTVPQGTYTSLKDIMGDDFDNTKSYKFYVNDFTLGLLQVNDDNSDIDARGLELTKFNWYEIGTNGATTYLRGVTQAINIWVEEVASA